MFLSIPRVASPINQSETIVSLRYLQGRNRGKDINADSKGGSSMRQAKDITSSQRKKRAEGLIAL